MFNFCRKQRKRANPAVASPSGGEIRGDPHRSDSLFNSPVYGIHEMKKTDRQNQDPQDMYTHLQWPERPTGSDNHTDQGGHGDRVERGVYSEPYEPDTAQH